MASSDAVVARLDALREDVKELKDAVTALDHQIRGNGKPGLILRVDRLERAQASRKWLQRTAIGAMFTLAAERLFSLIWK